MIKPTRRTHFPNLLRHETLHVLGISSAHHQEFMHCTFGTGICHTSLNTAFEEDKDGTGVPSWETGASGWFYYKEMRWRFSGTWQVLQVTGIPVCDQDFSLNTRRFLF